MISPGGRKRPGCSGHERRRPIEGRATAITPPSARLRFSRATARPCAFLRPGHPVHAVQSSPFEVRIETPENEQRMAVEVSSELVSVVALLGAGVVAVPIVRRLGLGSVLG